MGMGLELKERKWLMGETWDSPRGARGIRENAKKRLRVERGGEAKLEHLMLLFYSVK